MKRSKAVAFAAIAVSGVMIASPGVHAAAKKTTKKTTKKATTATTAAPTTAAPVTTAAAPATTAAPAANTAPVKVMVIATLQSPGLSFPEIQSLWDARAKAVNDAGGAGGHQIQMIFCNDKNDPNEAANCARKAVSEKVVAASGQLTLMGDSILSVLEPAGIPWVGSSVLAPKDSSSKVAYPFSGGVFTTGLALGQMAVDNGCRVAVGMSGQTAAGGVYLDSTKKAFELSRGLWDSELRADPATIQDFAPVAASLLKTNPQCLFALNAAGDNAKLLGAILQTGKKVQVFSGTSSIPQQLVSALPAQLTEGALLAGASYSVNDDTPEIAEYVKEATKYGVSTSDQAGSFGVAAWGTAKVLFGQIAQIKGEVTAEAVRGQLDKMTDPGTTIFGGKFGFTKESKLSGYNRVTNFNYLSYKVVNKKLVFQKIGSVAALADKFA